MTASVSFLGDSLGDVLGDVLGDFSPVTTLLTWADGTFVNTSTRHVWNDGEKTLSGPFASGVPAVVVIDDERYLQVEGARSSYVVNIDGWTMQAAAVRTSGQTDPLGGTGAYKIENINTTGANETYYTSSGGVNNAALSPSIFIKRITTTGVANYQNRGGGGIGRWLVDSADLPDFWDRVTDQHDAVAIIAAWVNNGTGQDGPHLKGQGGSVNDYFLYFPSHEEGAFPSSPIVPGSSTRNADSMVIAAGDVDSGFLSEAWVTKVTAYHGSADVATSAKHYIFFLNATNYLGIVEDGAGNVQFVLATTGGNLTRTVTYPRNGTMTVTANLLIGELTIGGATTGDGTTSGTVSAWPVSTAVRVGADDVVANNFFGRTSEPRPP